MGKNENVNDKIVKLHTTTHLLHAALRQILGDEVRQMGSNINEERMRFDFTFNRKVSDDEIKQIFQLVKALGDFNNVIYLLSFDKEKILSVYDTAGEL